MSTYPDALAEAVRLLARGRGWRSISEIHRGTGVARSTLDRIFSGEGARGDTLAKLEDAFELPAGTLTHVQDEVISLDRLNDILDRTKAPAPVDSSGVTYRSSDDLRLTDEDEVRRLEEYHRSRLVYEGVERSIRLMGITEDQMRRLGWDVKSTQDRQQPDLLAIRNDAAGEPEVLIVEVKTVHPGNEADAISSALGKLMLYRAGDLPEDEYGSRLVLVTDYPIDDQLVEQLKNYGVHHAWPGDWTAIRPG